MAQASIGKMFNGIPGEEQVSRLVLKKIRREMSKLDESTLQQYLMQLEMMASAIRTGEGFERLMAEGPEEV